jgi:hypothetical protein
MSSIKSLTTALVAAGAIAAPAASAVPVYDPIAVSQKPAPRVVQATSADNGFDWGDAGIGAGGAVAIALMSLGGVAGARRAGRRGHRVSPAS